MTGVCESCEGNWPDLRFCEKCIRWLCPECWGNSGRAYCCQSCQEKIEEQIAREPGDV